MKTNLFLFQAIKLLADNAQAFYYTSFRLGLCLPAQCSVGELEAILSSGKSIKKVI